MQSFVPGFKDIDKSATRLVGAKAANLAELSRIEALHVPDGFCISTAAFKKSVQETAKLSELLEQLSLLKPGDRAEIGHLSAAIRSAVESSPIPEAIVSQIISFLSRYEDQQAWAVRSSATAEDLPTASFAGQQDSYLNITGKGAVLEHVRKCWASLYSERAIVYRFQNGIDQREVEMAVLVQQMVFAQASGVMFTADPVNGNRKTLLIEAGYGLGEAMVAGLMDTDCYQVEDGVIKSKRVPAKKMAIYASPRGGTATQEPDHALQNSQVLTDDEVGELATLGRNIEAYFGCPQDIEWCLQDGRFYIVQSRPITTLFPIPQATDSGNHVFVSVGHQQMMTDTIKPLGLAIWQLTVVRPMAMAGGRLFVDVTQQLASAEGRRILTDVLGKSDPLIKDALTTLLERGDFIPRLPDEPKENNSSVPKTPPAVDFEALNDYDPAVVAELIASDEAARERLKQQIQTKAGTDLFDFIIEDIQQLKKVLFDPKSFGIIMTAMNAASRINEKMQDWLGEKNAANNLSQSLANNVTSEMGLALLDVADAIRPWPAITAYLQQAKDDPFLDGLIGLAGGQQAFDAIHAFLDKYGMRCAGEIDITRDRWSEKPITLVPAILSNINNLAPGAGRQKFEQGLQEALQKEQELLERLKTLPGAEEKISETKRMIRLVRDLAGYREYPKYGIVRRYFIYKQALLKEAERLVRDKVIHNTTDIFYLSFEELREVVRSGKLNKQLISERKEQYKQFEKLNPPRVITSDGEIINGSYRKDQLPANALAGLAVSSGIVEGRARVILSMQDAAMENGDILVTRFTDPSWTPLFLTVKALVTEVGGLMTHGAVIAREYGLPAVVGVEHASTLIRDGQRIRVNGTDGYVEIL